jgi:hypothetical protein
MEGLVEDLDEVGRERSDHARVASQTASPPGAVACVEAFDKVALQESEITLSLSLVR